MILDDVYSNVDKETQSSITGTLNDLAETTLLIQLFSENVIYYPASKRF